MQALRPLKTPCSIMRRVVGHTTSDFGQHPRCGPSGTLSTAHRRARTVRWPRCHLPEFQSPFEHLPSSISIIVHGTGLTVAPHFFSLAALWTEPRTATISGTQRFRAAGYVCHIKRTEGAGVYRRRTATAHSCDMKTVTLTHKRFARRGAQRSNQGKYRPSDMSPRDRLTLPPGYCTAPRKFLLTIAPVIRAPPTDDSGNDLPVVSPEEQPGITPIAGQPPISLNRRKIQRLHRRYCNLSVTSRSDTAFRTNGQKTLRHAGQTAQTADLTNSAINRQPRAIFALWSPTLTHRNKPARTTDGQ